VRREYIDGIIARSKELLNFVEEVIPAQVMEKKKNLKGDAF